MSKRRLKLNTISEADIQASILQYLSLRKIFAWRMPVGPVVHRKNIKGTLKEFWKASPLKGFPDIAGVFRRKNNGKFFVIEVKRRDGRLTPAQVDWIKNLEEAGAACLVARSVRDVEKFMIEWGEIAS